MTDSIMTNPKFTYEKLKEKLLKFEVHFKKNIKNKIKSIKSLTKECPLLDINKNIDIDIDIDIEKKWKIIVNLIKELKEVYILFTELKFFFKIIEDSTQGDNKTFKKLEQDLFQLRLQHESDRLFYNKMQSLSCTVTSDMIDLFKKELDLPKSIERHKVEDKILNEMVCEFSNSAGLEIIKKIAELSRDINLKRSFKFISLSKAIDEADENFEIIKVITELLINQKEEYNSTDQKGYTVLHRAVIVGHVATVELILNELSKEDKDINPKNKIGITPFHFSIEQGDPLMIGMFLDALVNKKQQINAPTPQGTTPLHMAVDKGNLPLFKRLLTCLLESNQEINPASQTGLTPLHEAAVKSNTDIFDLLLDSIDRLEGNINPTACDDKRTVLHMLAEKRDFKLFEKLLMKLVNKNKEINPACTTGVTPLHIASQFNNEEIVKLLIKEIKLKEGELSPKFFHSGQNLTPFLLAAANVHFNLVELFLKEKSILITEEINPKIKEGKTLFQLAISFKKTEVVKQILEVFLNREKNVCFYTGKKELPVKQMCEAFVLTHEIEGLHKMLNLLKNEESFESFCIPMLVATSLYKNYEIAERMILFLSENKEVTFVSHVISQSNRELSNSEGRAFLAEIKKSILREKKRIKDLRSLKISDLRKVLIEEKCTETLSQDKSLLESVKEKYNVLYSTIEEGIKCLNEIKNETILEEKFKTLREDIKPILADYKKLEDYFLIKEEEQVQECLRPFKDQIQWSRDLLEKSEKEIELRRSRRTNNADLKLKIEDLAETLKFCQSEIDETHYFLSSTIQDKFKILSEYSRSLLRGLIIFGGQDKENQEKDIAQKQQNESQILEEKIEKIIEGLNRGFKKIDYFIEESTAYLDQIDSASTLIDDSLQEKVKLFKSDLLNFKEKAIFLENKEEKSILKDALGKEAEQIILFQEKEKLELKLALLKPELFNLINAQRKILEKEWLIKVKEIQSILYSVLNHSLYNLVMSNEKDDLYLSCAKYKKHFNFLEKSKLYFSGFNPKDDLSKEHKRIVDLKTDLLKKKKWLEKKTEEVRSVEQELTIRAFNETKIKIDNSQKPRQLYLPSSQNKPAYNKNKSKKTSIPLLGCYLEVERANQIVELLNSDKNTKRDLIVKKSALFLSIAMVCESLKHTENEMLLKKTATEVRNAIYHALIEEKMDEEKYQQLMIFTNELCHKGMMHKLESFFNIFPKTQPDYMNYIAMIHTHIQCLGQYYEKIENNTVNIEEDLILQSDIAFRLAQIFALQTDLSKVREGEGQANKEIKSQLQEMFKNLNMKKSMFRALANEVRHGGVEGVNIAINEWLMAVGGALSERSFRQDKKNKENPEGLNRKIAKLSL